MAHVADHLSVVELEERYRTCTDACSARHYQTIWLLAQGHTIEEAAETTCFVPRWIEELLARYNAIGPQALGDLRRNNGAPPSVLKPELLAKLKVRLQEPPPDGGLWTSGKVAHWMAGELGLAKVGVQRGWEALKAIGWSIQSPRPWNPQAASAAEDAAKKNSPTRSPKRVARHPADLSRWGPRITIGLASSRSIAGFGRRSGSGRLPSVTIATNGST
jgi:transposase